MKGKLAIAMFGQKRLSREGGIEIVVKELCTRMTRNGYQVTCYNRSGHHVSGAEYDRKTEYEGICQKYVPTIEKKRTCSCEFLLFFAALYSAFGKYDVVHIHAEGPAFFAWLPKLFGKRVVVTIHGIDWQRAKWGDLPANISRLERRLLQNTQMRLSSYQKAFRDISWTLTGEKQCLSQTESTDQPCAGRS